MGKSELMPRERSFSLVLSEMGKSSSSFVGLARFYTFKSEEDKE